MKKYKVSYYNLITKANNGDLLVANLLNSSFVKFSREKFGENIDDIEKILEGKNIDNLGLEKYKELIKGGFLVKDSVNEESIAELKYLNNIIYNDTLEITIIPTDDCNFKCIYCYQERERYNYMSKDTMYNILKYIEKSISQYKRLKINWFGGEPLLAIDLIIEFMEKANEICKKKRIPIISAMTTNGYELQLEVFKKLISQKVIFYQITLDGVKETHNKQRPHKSNNDSYERIVKNLEVIKNNISTNFQIILRINTTKSLLEYMPKYISYMQGFTKDNRFKISWEKVSNYGGEKINNIENEMLTENKTYYGVIENAVNKGISSSHLTEFGLGASLCSANKKNSFYIDYDGTILKCSLAIYDDEFSDLNRIGYIDIKGNLILDESKECEWLIRKQTDNKCKYCTYYPICYQAFCPYRSKLNNKNICFKKSSFSKIYMHSMNENKMFKEI